MIVRTCDCCNSERKVEDVHFTLEVGQKLKKVEKFEVCEICLDKYYLSVTKAGYKSLPIKHLFIEAIKGIL